ncbi:hypothetical protein GH733_010603, partial [Mirounga leonina]
MGQKEKQRATGVGSKTFWGKTKLTSQTPLIGDNHRASLPETCRAKISAQGLGRAVAGEEAGGLVGTCEGSGRFAIPAWGERIAAQLSLWALFTSSLAISLVFAVIPLCRDVKVLASVMALAGLAMGCIDTVANMQLVRIYQKDSAIFLQVLHFFVGFGALLSPLIADPFLSEAGCLPANGTANSTSGSHLFHASRVLGQHHAQAWRWSNQSLSRLPPQEGTGTRVSYAFWIMALINLPVPMAVLFLLSKERLLACCPQRRPLLLSADELALETQPPEKEDASSLPPKFQPHPDHEDLFSCCQRKNFKGAPYSFFAIHITAALVLFMTDGMTGEYSAFVYSYAVEKPLSVGHKVAGYLPSLFWGFITLGRLISIPISSKVKPATMVFINVVGVVMTFLVLLVFSYNVAFLFVGTASLGLFLSSTFPSMLAYTEDILQYKGCATTVLVTGAGIGEMVLQMLVGSIFQAQGSYSFLVCGVIFGCLAFTFYILLLFFHRMHPGLSSGQSPRNGKLRVLPEVKLGEGGRRRPPGSWAPAQTQVFETIRGGSGGPSLHALARIFSANPWL